MGGMLHNSNIGKVKNFAFCICMYSHFTNGAFSISINTVNAL